VTDEPQIAALREAIRRAAHLATLYRGSVPFVLVGARVVHLISQLPRDGWRSFDAGSEA
jgi:hypothetical protein